jgi:hypothetical protein
VQTCNAEGAYDACNCAGDTSNGGTSVAAGGSFSGAGGSGAVATGGVSNGAVTGSGGTVETGGVVGGGGVVTTGGTVGTGGDLGTGGVVGTGGDVGTGGLVGTGGDVGTGGVAGSSGTLADCPAPPPGTSDLAVQAWTILNETRLAMGGSCMNSVTELVTSAQKHCDYIALNSSNSACVPDGHTEVQGCTGYTGTTAIDREIAAGYPSTLAYTETKTTYGNNPSSAIPSWIDTPFHRIPLLDPWTVDMGYGGAAKCDVIDIGRGTSSLPADTIAVYPYDGQTNVPAAWNGLEAPTPPAPAGGFPSSYPVSIYAQGLSVTEHVLTKDGDSTPLDHVWLDSKSSLVSSGLKGYFYNTAILYGAPFALSTKYRVRIAGTHTGGSFSVEWTFTTGATRPWGT